MPDSETSPKIKHRKGLCYYNLTRIQRTFNAFRPRLVFQRGGIATLFNFLPLCFSRIGSAKVSGIF
jgi:hypothetical protein